MLPYNFHFQSAAFDAEGLRSYVKNAEVCDDLCQEVAEAIVIKGAFDRKLLKVAEGLEGNCSMLFQ